jgi:hypothetical protein
MGKICGNLMLRAFPGYVAALFWVIAGLDPAIHSFAKWMDPRVKPAGDEVGWCSLMGKCSRFRAKDWIACA